ncbi:hypothetical protein UM590_03380 [Staphylococcus aureus]|nr:hypothetical protein UM590_03380 [Staphylococcus aureus]
MNELNGNERVAEAKTQAKQTIDQLTHLMLIKLQLLNKILIKRRNFNQSLN